MANLASPAAKRYSLRVAVAMVAYVGLLLGAVWAFQRHLVDGPLGYLVAVAPALPLVAVIASMGLFLKEEEDEFQRSLMIEQILWGTGATLVVASIWGFLENFGLAQHFEAYFLVVLWFAMFGLARCLLAWRYR